MKHAIFLPLLLVISFSVVGQESSQSTAQSTVQSSAQQSAETELRQPKMRPVDRDWAYFKSISCNDISRVVFHSRSEEMLLAKRKSQCLNKYKAFLPVPVER